MDRINGIRYLIRIAFGIMMLSLLLAGGAGATKFIRNDITGGDCSSIGTWNSVTQTCTLTMDVTETIQIESNSVTLDGNQRTIKGDTINSGIYLIDRNGVTIKNLNVRRFMRGIHLTRSNNNYLNSNNVSNNNYGLFLGDSSYNNTLVNNNASNNNFGIILHSGSCNNTLSNNNASNNNNNGITLSSSNYNTLSGNTANSNYDGISVWDSSSNNTINNNNALNNYIGIDLLYSSYNNNIYNNYFRNTDNFVVTTTIFNNIWNITKTSGKNIVGGSNLGGNFWANPNGTGFSQTCADTDRDGICDSVYFLDSANIDYLPLSTRGPVQNINKGRNYTNIQIAIDDANIGDEIHVDSGIYYENVNVNKQLTLRGIGMPVVDAVSNGSAITIAADGIILEGFTTKGAGSSKSGINVTSNNNMLRGNNVSNNYYGISLYSSSNNTLINNNAHSNSLGIFIMSSNFNNIISNIVSNSTSVGIKIYDTSRNNTLRDNKVTNNSYGIFFVHAFNTTASNNIMENNTLNFGVGGDLQSHFIGNNIDTTNLANGKPIYYVKFGKNTTYDASTKASTFYCVLCNNITVKDLEMSNMDRGVYFWSTSNSRIQNITVKESGWGLYLRMSSNNMIRDSKLSTNNILDYYETGISLISSDNNNFENNSLTSNNYGIELFSSSKNTIYNNYFKNNNNFVHTDATYGNTWNTTLRPGNNIVGGSYLGGNFWAYQSGTGYSQTCADTDRNGICDSKYVLDAKNTDHLPLSMNFTSNTTMADVFGVNNSTGATNTFVLVPIHITNSQNGPIAGIVFDISFDPNIINLTKIRVQRGYLTSKWDSPGFNQNNGRISLVYGGIGTEIPDGSSGSVVILNFSIMGSSGSKSAINISRIQLSDPDGIVGTAPAKNGTFTVSLKGDLNDNGEPADAGDLVLMKRASIGEISADSRFDMNNNGELADAGDLVLMKRASIGEMILSMSMQASLINTVQPNATDFGVNDVSGYPDTYILVPVNITNSQNGPIAGIVFDISFDSDILNLTETQVQRGELITSWDSPSFNQMNGRISLVYGGTGTEIPDDASGSVVILNFSIIGSSGSKSTINISRIQLSDPDGIVGTAPSRNGIFTINHLSENTPPVAVCSPDKLTCENAGAALKFNSSTSYDTDGTILEYYWEFGDGLNATGAEPKHTYATSKRNDTAYQPFMVNLTITDDGGLTNSTSQKVVIWMAGDANGDGKVNILDASVVGMKWGGNDPCADLNNDGSVNILDASIIGLNWGKTAIIGG